MKPFQFKLQALLTLRQREEQNALENYAQALLAKHNALKRLAEAETELSLACRQLQETVTQGATGSALMNLHQLCLAAQDHRHSCQSALNELERQLNLALQKMLAARKQRQAIDQFAENQRRAYARECLRREQKLIDELVQRRSNHRAPLTQPDSTWN